MEKKETAEKAVREIRRKTRRRFSAEEKIRIVIEGLRGEESIELSEIYHIQEIAFDRWGSVQVSSELQGEGIQMVQFGQGYASMSSPTKHLEALTLSKKLAHGGNPVLGWNISNLTVESDAAGNVKPSKKASSEKIDGAVALIMGLSRALVHNNLDDLNPYEESDLFFV